MQFYIQCNIGGDEGQRDQWRSVDADFMSNRTHPAIFENRAAALRALSMFLGESGADATERRFWRIKPTGRGGALFATMINAGELEGKIA